MNYVIGLAGRRGLENTILHVAATLSPVHANSLKYRFECGIGTTVKIK